MPQSAAANSLPLLQRSLPSVVADAGSTTEQQVVSLFDQFRGPLLRYLTTLGISSPDAEEIIQEVFLALFQHLRNGKSRENLRGWIFRVAHNLALKRRMQGRRDSAGLAGADVEDYAVDPGPNPEQHLTNRRAERVVIAVLQALPEQDRRCLALRAEGLTYREVAEVLEMSLASVSQTLARSLARIARATQR